MSRVILEMERKPCVRNFRKHFPRNRLLWLYGVTAVISFTIFVVFWCTNIFRDAILSTLEIRNGSTALLRWQRPLIGLVYKVYIFNYTNVHEFESGSADKLRVQELGPYVYSEHLTRVNVEMHENRTVTYQEKRSFVWEYGRQDDEIVVVPNIPLMSALAYSRDMNLIAQMGLTALLATLQAHPFVDLHAGAYLWGYDDKIFSMAKPFMSLKQKLPMDKFGILANKKGVNPDRITMHTGFEDHLRLGMIERINGRSDRNIWGDKECDSVYGTDGSMFPPEILRDRNKTIYVYGKDICRKVPFRYHSRSNVRGIPTYRYKVPDDFFVHSNTKNSCYCAKTSSIEEDDVFTSQVCPPAGIFNTTLCLGIPIVISFPHFYKGDPVLFQDIEGLTPEAERHETYIDMHPRLSVPISGWSRFQLNFEVRKGKGMPLSGRVKDGTILPLIWIEAGVDNVPESIQKALYQAHFFASAVEACCQWFSLIAVLLFLFGFVSTLRKKQVIEHACIPSADTIEQTKLPE